MYVSRSFEPFVCLSLPIPLINPCTLEDCFTCLNQEEYLIDDSRWFCMLKIENRSINLLTFFLGPKCQYLCNAKKCLEINKLPKVLIIQLKR
jgi:ubiquitin C-terminal hydrolase